MSEQFDTVVIGAGQAGLSAGYHLKRRDVDFVMLEADEGVGGGWRHRWDSMRLFTPSTHSALPGVPFPSERPFSFATSREMVDYLEDYAARHELPVRTGVTVDGVFRDGDGWVVTAGTRRFEARNVVICSGAFRVPKTPGFAPHLRPDIVQLHSADYRNPAQLRDGAVLVVGPGNSGADISLETAAAGHVTYLSGEHPGQIPIRIEKGRPVFPILWFVWSHVLNVRTPVGRRAQPKVQAGHEPLIRVKDVDLRRAGVQRVARVSGVVDAQPQLADGTVLEPANVIWCTGYRHDYSWIEADGIDPTAALPNERGVVTGHDGLYVLGQKFQFAFNSHTVGGVGRDAEYVVRHLVARRQKVPAHAV